MNKFLLFLGVILSNMVLAGPGDTLGVSFGSTPTFAPNDQAILLPYVLQGGYIYGVNGDPNNLVGIAQGYIVDEVSIVEGALMFVGAKTKGPANIPNTKLTFGLYLMSETGALNITSPSPFMTEPAEGPGSTAVTTGQLFFEELDTASLAYSYVAFDEPTEVSTNIAIGVDLTDLKTAGDTVGFICDNLGDAGGINYAFHRSSSGGVSTWYTSNSLFGGVLNNNIAIFPVMSPEDPSNTGAELTIGGLKSAVYPNPAVNSLTVSLSMETSKNAHLSLLQINGNELVSSFQVKVGKEITTHQIDISGIASGNYILIIEGENGERMARKVIISKE